MNKLWIVKRRINFAKNTRFGAPSSQTLTLSRVPVSEEFTPRYADNKHNNNYKHRGRACKS